MTSRSHWLPPGRPTPIPAPPPRQDMPTTPSAQMTATPTSLLRQLLSDDGGGADASTKPKPGCAACNDKANSSSSSYKKPILLPYMMEPVDDLRCGWDEDKVVSRPPGYGVFEGLSYCTLCLGVPRYPILMRPGSACSHVFCKKCIMLLVKSKAEAAHVSPVDITIECPVCRRPFMQRDVTDYDGWFAFMQMHWQTYRLRCVGKECKFVGAPDAVKKHEYDCAFRAFKCPCKGCEYQGTRTELSNHLHDCKFLRMFCDKCGTSYYCNGEGEYAIHNCLEELKAVAMMMKRELSKRGVFWPVKGTVAFEPTSAGRADFDSDEGTGVMMWLRKFAAKRKLSNESIMADMHDAAASTGRNASGGLAALATSSPAARRRRSVAGTSTTATNGSAQSTGSDDDDDDEIDGDEEEEESVNRTSEMLFTTEPDSMRDEEAPLDLRIASTTTAAATSSSSTSQLSSAPIVFVDYNEQDEQHFRDYAQP